MVLMRSVILLFVLLLGTATLAQDAANYFVEAEVDKLNPYVGQQIIYTFRLYSNVSLTRQGSIIPPDFVGFWHRDIGSIQRYATVIRGESYDVTESKVALFPSYAGALTIAESTLLLPAEPSRAGEVLATQSIVVNVRSLPDANNLRGFDGAVGQFEMQPTLDRNGTNLGEPVTLRLAVRGTGNVEQLPAPRLAENDVWRIVENPGEYRPGELEGRLAGEKHFEWLLTPSVAGEQMIPEIVLTYFDPSNQTYQTIATAPIAVNVWPIDEAISATPDTLPVAQQLLPLPASIQVSAAAFDLWAVLIWFVPPVTAFLAWWEMHRRDERKRNSEAYRRSEALKYAFNVLKHSQNAPPNLKSGLILYFANKLNTVPETLSYNDIEAALKHHVDNQQLVSRVMTCLENLDQALYAPVLKSSQPALSQQIQHLLVEVDSQWS